MAEEEKTDQEQNEGTEEQAHEETAAEQEAPADEAAAEEAPAEEEAPPEEAAEESTEDAAEGDSPPPADAEAPDESTEDSAEGADPDAPGSEAEEAAGEDLDWKTRRRLERSRQPVEARPQRSAEERQADRSGRRAAKAAGRVRHRAARRAKKGEPGTGTAPAERRANPAKVRQGVVVSDGADKTITVRIDIARRHPTYEKIVRRSRTLRAHDEQNEAGQGDVVRVVETRPISRTKRWRLVEVIEKAR
jgi:small subunit ribosomal protein S17